MASALLKMPSACVQTLDFELTSFLNISRFVLVEAWQANMDIQLIIDSGKVFQYMTKYVTKFDPNSPKSIIRIMKKLLKSTSDDGLPANTVLKRTMGKLIGERMISQQETSHLILSIPLVTCSKRFVDLFLENDSKPIDLSLL